MGAVNMGAAAKAGPARVTGVPLFSYVATRGDAKDDLGNATSIFWKKGAVALLNVLPQEVCAMVENRAHADADKHKACAGSSRDGGKTRYRMKHEIASQSMEFVVLMALPLVDKLLSDIFNDFGGFEWTKIGGDVVEGKYLQGQRCHTDWYSAKPGYRWM